MCKAEGGTWDLINFRLKTLWFKKEGRVKVIGFIHFIRDRETGLIARTCVK